MALTSRELTLAIDELVLEGVDASDAVVAAALQRSLGPALAEHGLESATGAVTTAVAGAVTTEGSR